MKAGNYKLVLFSIAIGANWDCARSASMSWKINVINFVKGVEMCNKIQLIFDINIDEWGKDDYFSFIDAVEALNNKINNSLSDLQLLRQWTNKLEDDLRKIDDEYNLSTKVFNALKRLSFIRKYEYHREGDRVIRKEVDPHIGGIWGFGGFIPPTLGEIIMMNKKRKNLIGIRQIGKVGWSELLAIPDEFLIELDK